MPTIGSIRRFPGHHRLVVVGVSFLPGTGLGHRFHRFSLHLAGRPPR